MLRLLGPLLRTLRLLTHHAHCCCWLIKVITELPLQMVACLFSSCRSTRSIIPLRIEVELARGRLHQVNVPLLHCSTMRAQFVKHCQSWTGVLLPTCESRLVGRRLLRIELLGGFQAFDLDREEGGVLVF